MTVIGYLLSSKDEKQQKELEEIKRQHEISTKLLWEKHDADVSKLATLELQIASQHYNKLELDSKFDKMASEMKEGFASLGGKFDALTAALIANGNPK